MCPKKRFIRLLGLYKPCCRELGHLGSCTPDLKGEKFGSITVLRFLGIKKEHSRWLVEQNGRTREVAGSELTSGKTLGLFARHGFATRKIRQPEYCSVVGHFRHIVKNKIKQYRGMPFHREWNPLKGGHLWRGADWIIQNLGKRPGKNWSLDIIKQEKGFVPGNLRWALKRTQRLNQMHRRPGLFLLWELRVEAKRRGYKLVRI